MYEGIIIYYSSRQTVSLIKEVLGIKKADCKKQKDQKGMERRRERSQGKES